MRVAMYYNNRDVRLEELPCPVAGPGELLVRIHASGICGSDVMEWYRAGKAPLVLGHEMAGEVAAVGAGVTGFKPGDRVAATHHVPWLACPECLGGHETVCDLLLSGTHFDPGGFCEYARLAAVNVERGTWRIPDDLSYDDATFVEPLACVLRGQRLAGLKPGMSVLVLGSGISGLLHVHLASVSGAGFVAASDLSDYRLQAARRFGASAAYRADGDVPGAFMADNQGRGADLVVVCASARAALEQALGAVARGGVILLFAPTGAGELLPLSVNKQFWRRDLTITTTYAGGPADCAAALALIANRRLRVAEMITHRLPLAEAAKGFALVAQGGESIKVIIRPQE